MNRFLHRFLGWGRRCGRSWTPVWLLTLWAASSLGAQPLAFRRFDDRDGLPTSQVTALLEDRDGFLWMGTAEGLARLGASGFRAFGAREGLQPTMVSCLMQDRRGSIWVGGQEKGVAEIRGSRIRNFGEAEGLAVTNIFSLLERANGELLVGARQGLFRKRDDRFERVELPDPWKYLPVFALAEDAQGGVWMGSRKGHLLRWDGKEVEKAVLPPALAEKSIVALQRDPEGRLWALSPEMLLRRDDKREWVPYPLPALGGHPSFENLSFSPSGGELLLAMGTDGLLSLERRGGSRVWTYRDGLPREGIRAAIRDRRGVLWIGSNGGDALAQAVPNLHSLESDPETGVGLGLGTLTCFLELPAGRVLMGGSRGLFLWEEGRGLVGRWQRAPGSSTFDIWALQAHPQGGAWIGTDKGLFRWKDGRIEAGCGPLRNVSIASLLLHAGRLWVGTLGEGLAELSPEGRFIAFHALPQEIGKGVVPKVLPWNGAAGEGLLVATTVGLYHFRVEGGRGRFERAFGGTKVHKASIATIYQEPAGRLWASTGDGLYGFDDEKADHAIHLGSREASIQGVPNWVWRLPAGQLAVGHMRGVSIIADRSVVLLTKNRGLISDETTTDAVMLDSQQRLWIGMKGGFCRLDTRQPFRGVSLPRPKVMEVAWGAESRWLPERVDLPPRPGTLYLLFDTGLPASPVAPRYQVLIEGLDPDWRDANATSYQVAQIGAGSYRFRLRASLDGREWVESDPLPIHVRPAWYQFLAVRILFLLLGGGLVAFLVYWRLRGLRREALVLEARVEERTESLALRNKSLERLHHQLKHSLESRVQLMRTVSHDLRSPLTSIMLSVDRLRDAEADPPRQTKLNVLDREAKRMEAIIRGLLDQARSEALTDSLNQRLCRPSEVMEGLTDTLRMKAEARELSTQLDLDPSVENVWILADATALQQVLFNLIENALKFTDPSGTVGIRSGVQGGSWVLEVWDTGRGIDPAHLQDIFQAFRQTQEGDERKGWGLGLSICKTMVEAHAGRIEVASEVGQGSTFRVVLPLVLPREDKPEA